MPKQPANRRRARPLVPVFGPVASIVLGFGSVGAVVLVAAGFSTPPASPETNTFTATSSDVPRPAVAPPAGPPAIPPTSESAFPNTTSGIHIGVAFDDNITDAQVPRIDYVWGGADYHLARPYHADVYLPAFRVPNEDPHWNNLAWWKANHPDWVVYKADKTTPAYEYGDANIPLDISNPAVRQFQIDHIIDYLKKGYAGVAWDNTRLSNDWKRRGIWRNGQWVELYSGAYGDTVHRDHTVAWAKATYEAIKAAAPDRTVIYNLSIDNGEMPDSLTRMLPYADAILDELAYTKFGRSRLTGAPWVKRYGEIQQVNAAGKAWVMINNTKGANDAAIPAEEIEWVIANYLIAKGDHTYMSLVAEGTGSSYFYDRPEFSAPIGAPTEAATDTNGIARRTFSGGIVYVNHSSSSAQITVPAGHKGLHGETVGTTVTLPAATGRVFLNPRG